MSAGSIAHIEARGAKPWRTMNVRERILEEHREIRDLLDETLSLTQRVLSERDEESLRLAVRALVLLFAEHLNSEESILVPALLEIEPWGPACAERLQQEHDEQRELLKHVFTLMRERGEREALRDAAQAFVELMLADMAREEEDLLFALPV